MIYEMNLCSEPYQMIKSGQKTVEMRLFDERRKGLQKGDHIIFHCPDYQEDLKVEVMEIKTYRDFEELYAHYSSREIGYRYNEKPDPKDMLQYYSEQKISQYGVMAIRIRLLE